MADDSRKRGVLPSAEQAAGGMLAGHDKAMELLGEWALRETPRMARLVAKRIPGAPGLVYDAAGLVGADDRWRAGFGLAGSLLGGASGAGFGALAGGVNAPIGAAIGSAYGDKLATEYYDDHRRQIDATKRWVADHLIH